MSERERTYALNNGPVTGRRLEVRDGAMWAVTDYANGGSEGYQRYATVDDAVADALDVLRAAGWTVHTWHDPMTFTDCMALSRSANVARSLGREVSDGE